MNLRNLATAPRPLAVVTKDTDGPGFFVHNYSMIWSRTLGNDCPQFGKLALHRLCTMEEIHGLPVEYSVLQCSLV